MHINPSMAGPVILRRREKGAVPGAVAFAGAEFVVVGKTVVGVEEVWEVVSELSEFFASQFAEDLDKSPPPSPPRLKGVPESHTKHGTARSTLFVPATAEGMLTLLEGQAPGDIDRFKAWHMDPEFHTISHHVWGLEDLRIFLFLHRLLFVFWVVPFTVQQLSGLLRIIVLCGYLVMLACQLSAHEDWLYEYYRSRVGQAVVAVMRVLLVVWCVVRKVLKVASMLARELVTQMMTLPGPILGEKGVVIMTAIFLVVVEVTHLVAGIVHTLYRAGVDLTIACLPRVPWLASSVRFADAALGYLLNLVFVLFLGSVSLVLWWYSPPKEAPSVQTEKRYRELLEKTDPESKEELAKFVKGLISNLRHENEVAMERRRNIKTKGARDCFGGRRVCAHGCTGALAVAATKLKRKASSQEMAHIKLILAKSGIIRDSLVRTARVMLSTDPTKAVAEVSHELFHAAYDGLIWPDEPLIGKALQSEGRDPTAENVNWHRAKWVAVAAELIVDQEHTSWFKVPPGSTIEGGDTFRDSEVHPAERCVHCYTPQEGSNSSAAAAAATRHRCMKTEGRKPSARFSACRSAVKQSKRRRVLPRCELAEEKCCVIPADSENFTGMVAEYPYFHAEGRRAGVDDPERSRRLAVRVRSLDEKFDWLVSLDKEMAEAKAAARRPASGPQDGQPNAKDQEEDGKTTRERKAAQERKARRVKARKERAKEAEAVRLQRLKELEELIAAEGEEDGHGSAEGDSPTKEEEEEEEDEASLCIVCMAEKRNACLVHGKTAHLVVCLPCGKRIKKANMGCPICQRRIDVVIESFTS
ncbi:unnamed protein product [Ectocarpus sp. CCAP 1310/34]|nr:unnamed protein product [Ectocarpus sp. CCAP 1310/34]